jgi:hypothetical protein
LDQRVRGPLWYVVAHFPYIRTNGHCNQVGQKVLVQNDGILHKADSRYLKEPLTMTSVQTNGKKSERMKIQRVKPFKENLQNK